MIPSNKQALVSHAVSPTPDIEFDVLHFVECGLHDCLLLMELCRVLSNKCTNKESRMTEIGRLKE